MAYNGSGLFVRLYSWAADAAAGINIRADRSDAELDGIATGLSTCITKDGQSTTTAIIPFALGLSAAALLDLSNAAAGQVKFPATQNPSADANTLDDYEEGTFTPTLGGTATYASNTGRYTKIGRLVYINIDLSVTLIGSGSATTISGLPYTAASISKGLSLSNFTTLVTSVVALFPQVNAGSTQIGFTCLTAAAGSVTSSPNLFQNGTVMQMSGCYEST